MSLSSFFFGVLNGGAKDVGEGWRRWGVVGRWVGGWGRVGGRGAAGLCCDCEDTYSFWCVCVVVACASIQTVS